MIFSSRSDVTMSLTLECSPLLFSMTKANGLGLFHVCMTIMFQSGFTCPVMTRSSGFKTSHKPLLPLVQVYCDWQLTLAYGDPP